jgi:hypothetical protein
VTWKQRAVAVALFPLAVLSLSLAACDVKGPAPGPTARFEIQAYEGTGPSGGVIMALCDRHTSNLVYVVQPSNLYRAASVAVVPGGCK